MSPWSSISLLITMKSKPFSIKADVFSTFFIPGFPLSQKTVPPLQRVATEDRRTAPFVEGSPFETWPFTSYKYWTNPIQNPIYRMYNPIEITSYKFHKWP